MIIAACRGDTPGCIPGLGQLGACIAEDDLGNCIMYDGGGAAPAPASSPSWWQDITGGAFKTAEQILLAKNQTRGILTQTAPGQFTYVQPEGSQVTLPVNVSPALGGQLGVSTSPGMGLILAGGVALLVVVMMARKG